MKLCDAISRYIAYKQAIGMVFETEATILWAFTEKVGANMPVAKITSESVLQYLNGRGPVTLFWHRKHDALSGLWRFAIQHGCSDFVTKYERYHLWKYPQTCRTILLRNGKMF